MACARTDWACQLANAPGEWLKSAAGQSLQALADAISQSVGQTLSTLGSVWATVPTPDLVGGNSAIALTPPVSAEFETLLSWSMWISLAICILSLFAVGVRLVVRPRDAGRSISRLGVVFAAVLLISGAVGVVSAILQNPSTTTNASTPVAFIQSSLTYYVGGMAILSIIIGGGRMAWQQRLSPGQDLFGSLLTLTVVSGAGLAAIQLAVIAADSLASWILSSSTAGTDFGQNLVTLIALSGATTGALGPIVVIVLGSIAMLASLVQIALMVLRAGMLVLLAGIFPLSASFTNTATGKAWFQKCLSWLIAFILYKPAAAIVYATAFQLVGSDLSMDDGTGLLKIITGVVMMVLALSALPALMRFLAPMVSPAGGGGQTALALAGAGGGALGEMATGAVRRVGGGAGKAGGPGDASSQAATGSATTASKPAATNSASAASGVGSSAAVSSQAAAGSSAATAAGPVGIGLVAAQKAGETGKAAGNAVKGAAEDALGSTPTA
jgi:type IV secretion system protein TrbL